MLNKKSCKNRHVPNCTGNIDNYYVEGELVSAWIGMSKIGVNHLLPTQEWIVGINPGPNNRMPHALKNHLMNAVKTALKEDVY